MDKDLFKKIFLKNPELRNLCLLSPLSPAKRRDKAFDLREDAAEFYENQPLVDHPCNGDEKRFPTKIASYSKALPHNTLGEVDIQAYNKYLEALKSGNPEKI